MQTYVQKIGHDGRPLGPPQPGSWHKPPSPRNVTPEGVEAVAAALGMERVDVEAESQVSESLRAAAGRVSGTEEGEERSLVPERSS